MVLESPKQNACTKKKIVQPIMFWNSGTIGLATTALWYLQRQHFRVCNDSDIGFRVCNDSDIGFRVCNDSDLGFRVCNDSDLGFRVCNDSDIWFRVCNDSDIGFKVCKNKKLKEKHTRKENV